MLWNTLNLSRESTTNFTSETVKSTFKSQVKNYQFEIRSIKNKFYVYKNRIVRVKYIFKKSLCFSIFKSPEIEFFFKAKYCIWIKVSNGIITSGTIKRGIFLCFCYIYKLIMYNIFTCNCTIYIQNY